MEKIKISFIGSGAWATALANVCADNNHIVNIYGINPSEIDEINNSHTNEKYYPKVKINENIIGTLDLSSALNDADIVVIAVPSHTIEAVLKQIQEKLDHKVVLLNVTKGFEQKTKLTMMEYIYSIFDSSMLNGVVSLIGPSFAEEVVRKQYTAITAVSKDENSALLIQKVFSNYYFRVYTNNDEIGCEYCSSLKNVIALASGILTGLGFENNSHAALITRGMAEISRFVKVMGGDEKTCLGLSGIGDLVLTCSSTKSRNYEAGNTIGSKGIAYFKEHNTKTVEGIFACELAYKIAQENNIYAPIITAIYNVVFKNGDALTEINKLMNNTLKGE